MKLRTILLVLLTALSAVCCNMAETRFFPDTVQLWEGGPYWAETNFNASKPEDPGSQLNYEEAKALEEFGWRLPTPDEIMKMKETCSINWENGGCRIAGTDGRSIFLPAAGYLSRKITLFDLGGVGHCWTSGEVEGNAGQAKEMYFHSVACGLMPRGRDNGLSVRLVRDDDAEVAAKVEPVRQFTGRGNCGESLLKMTIVANGPHKLTEMTFNVDADAESIARIKLVSGGKVIYDEAYGGSSEFIVPIGKRIGCRCELELLADVSETASEGTLIRASLVGAQSDKGRIIIYGRQEAAEREVLLTRKCLYKPGDYGSGFWRIPALRQLSDGTLLAVNDRRNDTENDLPGRIDVVYSISMDNGLSWSEPGYIAKNFGHMHGYGDPALVECSDGTVICFFTGGEIFTRSNEENPQRAFFSVSKDFGRSWTEPEEITSQMWGEKAINPACRNYKSSFFSSGNALLLTRGPYKGRILVSNVTGHYDITGLVNHVTYSDDCGKSWHVSDVALPKGGDEAKLVELSDGRILMSVRQNGERAFNISEDGGQSWGEPCTWPEMTVTACNGDLLMLDSGILLQSVPDSMTRENVTIYVSFDEGKTWPYKKCICHGPSQYSSMTVLKNGNIGIYTEENGVGLELWFESFSLDWLMSGYPGWPLPRLSDRSSSGT